MEKKFDTMAVEVAEAWAALDSRLTRWQVQAPLATAPAERELRRAARYIIGAVFMNLEASNSDMDATQIDNAEALLEKGRLSLLNAEHDATDAILTHMIEFLGSCERRSSLPDLIMQYPRYSELKERITDCVSILSNTRRDVASRADTYREKILPEIEFFASEYPRLVDVVERAVQSRETMENRILVSRRFFGFLNVFAIVAGAASLIGVPLAIWLWMNSPATFCENANNLLLSFFCE